MGNWPGNFGTGVILSFIVSVAAAQQLPKSGSISVHTGWKSTGEAVEVADKRVQGHGSVFGITFNDKGAGPLHGGPASCFYVFFANDNGTRNKGYCAFGDADGDRLFTDWHGSQAAEEGEGINEIVGGTGKYAGIQGSGPMPGRRCLWPAPLRPAIRLSFAIGQYKINKPEVL